MASGINNTFRQVGIATGIAALGAIFESTLRNKLASALVHTPVAGHAAALSHAVAAGGAQQVIASAPRQFRPEATAAIHSAFASAMNDVLLVGFILAVVGAVLAYALVRSSDFVSAGAPAEHPQEAAAVA
jgi:hypothetical protein